MTSASVPIHDRGFILRRLRFSETSLILWWLSAEHGLCKTLAKGALRPKQAFFGKTDLFYDCEFTFRKSTKAQLGTLMEIQVLQPHTILREDYAKVLAMTYFGELITQLTEPEAPVPELYDLFSKAIHYLGDHSPTHKIVERFERRVFQGLGLDNGNTPLSELHEKWLHSPPKSLALLQRELAKRP